MKYLTPTATYDVFIDNDFTSFRFLTHLGINNIQATDVLNENRLRKCTIIGDKQLQNKKKKERGHFEQRSTHQAKKQRNLCSYLGRQQGGFTWLHSWDIHKSPWSFGSAEKNE